MSVAKSSLGVLVAQIGTALTGFLGTLFIARVIGATGLGVYYLFVAVMTVLTIFIQLGLGEATVKRISEGGKGGGYLSASLLMGLSLFILIGVLIFVLKEDIVGYIGSELAFWAIYPALFLLVFFQTFSSALAGEKKVGRKHLLRFVRTVSRVITWVVFLSLGFKLIGLFSGYIVGIILGLAFCLYFLESRLTFPSRKHFEEIYSFARYSWVSSVRGLTLSWTDTIVLGFFVSSSLIGIYEICWKIGMIFYLPALAIGQSIFPNISSFDSKGKNEEIRKLVEGSMIFVGIFAIPGVIGSFLLGKNVLYIYGKEFTAGVYILTLLVFARIFHGYESGLISAINGLDRPDLAFKSNLAFIILNIFLNVVLIYFYGWIGAAVATIVSISIAFLLSYRYLESLVKFHFPRKEIGIQALSAAIMGLIVFLLKNSFNYIGIYKLILIIAIGATIYLSLVFYLSKEIRTRTIQLFNEILPNNKIFN